MGFYIGCGTLILIAVIIGFLFLRRKKIENELDIFYKNSQLYGVKEIPENIRKAIGDGKWYYFKGSVIRQHKPFEFYWLEKTISSTLMVNNSPQMSIEYFLIIAFPPNEVNQEFIDKVFAWKNDASAVKDFFIYNTDNPLSVEKLADGSFLIEWKVLNRADVYQKKLDWLQANIS